MLLPNILVHCELSSAFAHWWRQTFLDALASLRPILDIQQFWDKFHHASSRCVLSRKWLQLTGKVWWLESYQCEETSGSTRVVQQSKLIYDIDTLSNSGMCDMWKVLFSGKLKLRRWILFFFNLFSNNTWGAYIKIWEYMKGSTFYNYDPCVRVNFGSKSKICQMWGESWLELFCSPAEASVRNCPFFKAGPGFEKVERFRMCKSYSTNSM